MSGPHQRKDILWLHTPVEYELLTRKVSGVFLGKTNDTAPIMHLACCCLSVTSRHVQEAIRVYHQRHHTKPTVRQQGARIMPLKST